MSRHHHQGLLWLLVVWPFLFGWWLITLLVFAGCALYSLWRPVPQRIVAFPAPWWFPHLNRRQQQQIAQAEALRHLQQQHRRQLY